MTLVCLCGGYFYKLHCYCIYRLSSVFNALHIRRGGTHFVCAYRRLSHPTMFSFHYSPRFNESLSLMGPFFIIERLRLHLSSQAWTLSRDVSFYTRVGLRYKVFCSVSVFTFQQEIRSAVAMLEI